MHKTFLALPADKQGEPADALTELIGRRARKDTRRVVPSDYLEVVITRA